MLLKKMLTIGMLVVLVMSTSGCIAVRGVAYTSSLTIDEIGPNYGNLEITSEKNGKKDRISTTSRSGNEYASSANKMTAAHSGGSAADELNKRARIAIDN